MVFICNPNLPWLAAIQAADSIAEVEEIEARHSSHREAEDASWYILDKMSDWPKGLRQPVVYSCTWNAPLVALRVSPH